MTQTSLKMQLHPTPFFLRLNGVLKWMKGNVVWNQRGCMGRANGSHKWLDRNRSVVSPPPSSSASPSSFKSHILLTEWENDGVRTQSQTGNREEWRIFYKMTSAVYPSWELGWSGLRTSIPGCVVTRGAWLECACFKMSCRRRVCVCLPICVCVGGMSLLISFTLGTVLSYRHKQPSLTCCKPLSKWRQLQSVSPEGLSAGGGGMQRQWHGRKAWKRGTYSAEERRARKRDQIRKEILREGGASLQRSRPLRTTRGENGENSLYCFLFPLIFCPQQ